MYFFKVYFGKCTRLSIIVHLDCIYIYIYDVLLFNVYMSLHRLLTLYFYVILLLNVWASMSKPDQLYTFYVEIYVYCRI